MRLDDAINSNTVQTKQLRRITEILDPQIQAMDAEFNNKYGAGTPRFVNARPPSTLMPKQTIDDIGYELQKQYQIDYSGGSSVINQFAQGIMPVQLKEDKIAGEERAHPIARAAGVLTGYILPSRMSRGVAPAIARSVPMVESASWLARYTSPIANAVKEVPWLARSIEAFPIFAKNAGAKAAQSGLTFATKEISDTMAEMVGGEKKNFFTVLEDIQDSFFQGATLGAVGSIPSPLLRIPSEAMYGFVTAKLQNADDMSSALNAGLFAAFGMMNTRNLSEAYKQAEYYGATKALADRFVLSGMEKAKANNLAKRFMDYMIFKTGGFSKIKTGDFNEFSKNVHRGYKIIIEPEMAKGGKPTYDYKSVQPELSFKEKPSLNEVNARLRENYQMLVSLRRRPGMENEVKAIEEKMRELLDIQKSHFDEAKAENLIMSSKDIAMKKANIAEGDRKTQEVIASKQEAQIPTEQKKVTEGKERIAGPQGQAKAEGTVEEIPVIEGTGTMRPRGVSVSIEQSAIEKGLVDTLGKLPEYSRLSMKEQAGLAYELMSKDYEYAKDIAMGKRLPPEGILPESIAVAVSKEAELKGDVDLVRDLAIRSKLIEQGTVMGQRVRTWGELDEESPVAVIKDVNKSRKEKALNKSPEHDIGSLKEKNVKSLKESIKKELPKKSDWEDFIRSLQC